MDKKPAAKAPTKPVQPPCSPCYAFLLYKNAMDLEQALADVTQHAVNRKYRVNRTTLGGACQWLLYVCCMIFQTRLVRDH